MEKDLGRKAKTKPGGYEARLIDIDILFFDDRIIQQPALTVPHPRLHLRRFTLLPLNELMPDWMHPLLKKTVRQLLRECPDDSDVRRIDQSFAP
jgi:2-amino-4-hydroxy-6-hydroxymethyldihydropteridine diphosphokinase